MDDELPADPFPTSESAVQGVVFNKNLEIADRHQQRQDEYNKAQCALLYASAVLRLCIGVLALVAGLLLVAGTVMWFATGSVG